MSGNERVGVHTHIAWSCILNLLHMQEIYALSLNIASFPGTVQFVIASVVHTTSNQKLDSGKAWE